MSSEMIYEIIALSRSNLILAHKRVKSLGLSRLDLSNLFLGAPSNDIKEKEIDRVTKYR